MANSVPPEDPSWLHHLAEHIKCDEPVFVESSLMTEDAANLVSQVSFFSSHLKLALTVLFSC